MRKITFLFLFLNIIPDMIFAQSSEFNQPWTDTAKAIIIDPYSENPIDFDKLITDKRIVAVIHKASQGNTSDKKYSERKILAKQNGLLWGSYHMGVAGDPVIQADFYLSLTGNDSTELLALDLESLDTAKYMSLENAEKFIDHIYSKTGRYPLVYCNNTVLDEISKNYSDSSIFSKCGLWYARFIKEIPDLNKNVWGSYAIWQFSCEINCKKTGACLYNVPGTAFDMDVNVYNGTIADLRQKWPNLKTSAIILSAGSQ